MAKKETDSITHLDDLDFKQSNFDSFNFEFEDFDSQSNRSPINKAKKGLFSGLKGLAKGVLPGIGKKISREMPHVDTMVQDSQRIMSDIDRMRYDLQKDLNPIINQFKITGKKIGQKFDDKLPQSVTSYLNSLEVEEKSTSRINATDVRESTITQAQQGLSSKDLKFEQTQKATQQKKEDTERFLDRKLTSSRHQEEMKFLDEIRKASMLQSRYQRSTQTAFYNKSLELQYRILFKLDDIFSSALKSDEIKTQKLEEIRHNSSLPDIQKKTKFENVKENLRGKIADRFTAPIMGVIDNVKKKAASKIGMDLNELRTMLSMADMSIDSMGMMSKDDQMEMLLEMGGEFAGNFAGNKIGGKIGDKVTKYFKPYMKDINRLSKHGSKLGLDYLNRKKGGYAFNKKDKVVQFLAEWLAPDIDRSMRIDNTLANSPTKDTHWDIQSRQTLVEIIPGYLAKQLQQLMIIASGKTDIPEYTYDMKKRDFVSSKIFAKSMQKEIFGDESSRAFEAANMFGTLRGVANHSNKANITTIDQSEKELSKLMFNMAYSGYLFNEDTIYYIKKIANGNKLSEMGSTANAIFKGIKKSRDVATLLLSLITNSDGTIDNAITIALNGPILNQMDRKSNILEKISTITNVHGQSRYIKNMFDEHGNVDIDKMSDMANDVSSKEYRDYVNMISRREKEELDENYNERMGMRDKYKDNKHLNKAYDLLDKYVPISSTGKTTDFVEFKGTRRRKKGTHRRKKNPLSLGGATSINGKDLSVGDMENVDNITNDCCNELKEIFSSPIDVNIVNDNRTNLTSNDQNNLVSAVDSFKEEFLKYVEEQSKNREIFEKIKDSVSVNADIMGSYFESFKLWASETNILSSIQLEFLKNLNPNFNTQEMFGYSKKLAGDLFSKGKNKAISFSDKLSNNKVLKNISSNTTSMLKGYWGGLSKIAQKTLLNVTNKSNAFTSYIGENLPGFMSGLKELGMKGLDVSEKMFGRTMDTIGSIFGRKGSKKDKDKPDEFFDIYSDKNFEIGKPLITKRQFEQGLKFINGSMVTSAWKITLPIIDPETGNTLITEQDIKDGLVNAKGEKIEASSSSGFNINIGKAINGISGLGKKVLGGIGNIGAMYGDMYQGAKTVAGDIYSGAKKWLGKKMGISVEAQENKKIMEDTLGVRLDLVNENILNIYKLLDDRIEDKNFKEGGYEDYVRDKREKQARRKNKATDKNTNDKKSALGGLLGLIPGGESEGGGGIISDYLTLKAMEKLGGGKLGALLSKIPGAKFAGRMLGKIPGMTKLGSAIGIGGAGAAAAGVAGAKGAASAAAKKPGFLKRLMSSKGGKLGALALAAGLLFGGGSDDEAQAISSEGIPGTGDGGMGMGDLAMGGLMAAPMIGGIFGRNKVNDKSLDLAKSIESIPTPNIPKDAQSAANKLRSPSGPRSNMLSSGTKATNLPDNKKAGVLTKIVEKFKNLLPDKFSKVFDKVSNFVSGIMKKLGSTGVGKIIAKFASPLGWALTAGAAAWAAISAYNNADEIVGCSEALHKPLSAIKRIYVGISGALSDALTLGLVPINWIAENIFGVTPEPLKSNVEKPEDAVKKEEAKTTEDRLNESMAGAPTSPPEDAVKEANAAINGTSSNITRMDDKNKYNQTVSSNAKTNTDITNTNANTSNIYAKASGKSNAIKPTGNAVKTTSGRGGKASEIPPPQGEQGWNALKHTIVAAARMVGVDPGTLATFAGIESTFRPNASSGVAQGLFQFTKNTWNGMISKYGKKYGLDSSASPMDPVAASLMGAEYIKEIKDGLSKDLGRTVTDTDIYLSYFLGPTGAKILLRSSPDTIAQTVRPQAAASNPAIFRPNGRNRTVAELIQWANGVVANWRNKVASEANSLAGIDPATETEDTEASSRLSNEIASGNIDSSTGLFADSGSSGSSGSVGGISTPGSINSNTDLGSGNENVSSGVSAENKKTIDNLTDQMAKSHGIDMNNSNANLAITDKEAAEGFSKFKTQSGVDMSYGGAMKTALGKLNAAFMDEYGRPMLVTSGKRSMQKQAELFKKLGPGKAAKPNPNAPHIKGYAIDINTPDLDRAEKAGLLKQFGFHRPFWPSGMGKTPPESWHLELQGARSGAIDPNAPEPEDTGGKEPTDQQLASKPDVVSSDEAKKASENAISAAADGIVPSATGISSAGTDMSSPSISESAGESTSSNPLSTTAQSGTSSSTPISGASTTNASSNTEMTSLISKIIELMQSDSQVYKQIADGINGLNNKDFGSGGTTTLPSTDAVANQSTPTSTSNKPSTSSYSGPNYFSNNSVKNVQRVNMNKLSV